MTWRHGRFLSYWCRRRRLDILFERYDSWTWLMALLCLLCSQAPPTSDYHVTTITFIALSFGKQLSTLCDLKRYILAYNFADVELHSLLWLCYLWFRTMSAAFSDLLVLLSGNWCCPRHIITFSLLIYSRIYLFLWEYTHFVSRLEVVGSDHTWAFLVVLVYFML